MIPKLHYISQGNSPKEHLDHIQKACASGAELVVLDLQDSSEKKYLKIAKQAREITAHFQTRLMISAHYKIAKDLKVAAASASSATFEHSSFDLPFCVHALTASALHASSALPDAVHLVRRHETFCHTRHAG